MFEVTVVIREAGKLKPDYSLPFSLPALPREGDYVSIQRPDNPEPWGEDLIVRKVWWRLFHPETGGFARGDQKVGRLTEIFVECDPAVGPYSSDSWRDSLSLSKAHEFEVERFSVRQSDLKRDEP